MTQRVNVQLWPEPLSPTSTWNEHVFSGWGEARLGVRERVAHVLGKLGAANRTEAVARARQLGLIP